MTEEFIKEFFSGYTEYINNHKTDMSYNLLDDIISQSLSKGISTNRITMLSGKSNTGSLLNEYAILFDAEQINKLRLENLQKLLNE